VAFVLSPDAVPVLCCSCVRLLSGLPSFHASQSGRTQRHMRGRLLCHPARRNPHPIQARIRNNMVVARWMQLQYHITRAGQTAFRSSDEDSERTTAAANTVCMQFSNSKLFASFLQGQRRIYISSTPPANHFNLMLLLAFREAKWTLRPTKIHPSGMANR
jgi:hypothetical protein